MGSSRGGLALILTPATSRSSRVTPECRSTSRSTESWPRSWRRSRHGVDEPYGRIVSPYRGAQHPDAHRRGEHFRGTRATLRAPRGDGPGQARRGPPLPREGPLRPAGAGRPVWVDDPHFNLGYHLRHSALPAPGTEEVLRRTAARIFAQHLDRRKPLWEIWMVEGVSENRWALLYKVHHCMVDGVSATDLMTVMFDDSPPQAPGERWQPAPEPTSAELVLHTLTRQTFNPSQQLRAVRAAVSQPRTSLAQAQALVRGVASAAGLLRPLGASSLTGSIGPHRAWSTARVDLSDVKAIRSALGGTVNDIVLTIVAGG